MFCKPECLKSKLHNLLWSHPTAPVPPDPLLKHAELTRASYSNPMVIMAWPARRAPGVTRRPCDRAACPPPAVSHGRWATPEPARGSGAPGAPHSGSPGDAAFRRRSGRSPASPLPPAVTRNSSASLGFYGLNLSRPSSQRRVHGVNPTPASSPSSGFIGSPTSRPSSSPLPPTDAVHSH